MAGLYAATVSRVTEMPGADWRITMQEEHSNLTGGCQARFCR